jgi:hypothetical protein
MTMETITLEDIAAISEKICTGRKVEIVREDYDEYGSKSYVKVRGDCANLLVEYIYNIGFKCSIQGHKTEDLSSRVEYHHPLVGGLTIAHHFSEFVTKESVKEIQTTDIDKITAFINANAQYLHASSEHFQRVDNINYPDLRGEERWGNGITSFDSFIVCDEDFYTGIEIKETRREKQIPPEQTNVDFLEAIKNW